jgi:flagellin
MTVINTNVKSLFAQHALQLNNRALAKAMEQLSSGKRINTAQDDAAGLAIASKMTSKIRSLDMAVRNAFDGASLLQTADGALIEVTNMLQRMRELTVQAANDTYTVAERDYLDREFQQLKFEINRIGTNTEWNGMPLLDGSYQSGTGVFDFQIGTSAFQTISVTIGNFRTRDPDIPVPLVTPVTDPLDAEDDEPAVAQVTDLRFEPALRAGQRVALTVASGDAVTYPILYTVTGAEPDLLQALASAVNGSAAGAVVEAVVQDSALRLTAQTAGAEGAFALEAEVLTNTDYLLGMIDDTAIATLDQANGAMALLDRALDVVNLERATLGAVMNRLEYAADNLANISINTSDQRSRILDTDFAKASSELARTQIINQAATAILAQANMDQQTVLKLLQG